MKRTTKFRIFAWTIALVLTAVQASLLLAQAPATSFLGTITAISGNSISVKTDAGEVRQVQVPETAVLKQVAPGERDLTKAETIQFQSLTAGDRVSVKLDVKAEGAPTAARIIAIKQADLAKKQAADQLDWQHRGIGGLVKSVDPATGVIVVTSGAGSSAKTVTVHTTPTTVLKRYAAASVRFDEARVAPLGVVKAGDQIKARGAKSADGTELTAEEAVSGSFRNIAGQVISVDAAAQTVTVKDLTTKKPATVKFTSESQLKKLPDMMASRLAAMLKGEAGGFAGRSGAGAPGAGAPGAGGPPAGMQGGPMGGMRGGPGGPGVGGFDPQMMLSRAPAIQLADLKKGDAVMMVATEGATDLTAISLLAGVEPILEAPAASNLLSNWSMGGGSGGGEMGQ